MGNQVYLRRAILVFLTLLSAPRVVVGVIIIPTSILVRHPFALALWLFPCLGKRWGSEWLVDADAFLQSVDGSTVWCYWLLAQHRIGTSQRREREVSGDVTRVVVIGRLIESRKQRVNRDK